MIDKEIKNYLDSLYQPKEHTLSDISRYFKLPFTGKYSAYTKSKLNKIISKYCREVSIKLVFTTFKIGSVFSCKDLIPQGLKSNVVYKFNCAGCNACYIGETTRHFTTRVKEHLQTDKNSHVYKHIHETMECF